ncbi:MAG: T9SS type A sorting domain-containing protein [Bacteroidetes bacterium]|nr:T9SS type A sorting domain-containing protein [Bacteroidota bacterium]
MKITPIVLCAICALCIAFGVGRAQITSEHKYHADSLNIGKLWLLEVDSADWRYVYLTGTSNADTISVYTLAHQLEKVIPIPLTPPKFAGPGYPGLRLEYFARRLFDLDDQYEYLVYTGSELSPSTYIFNESGKTVFSCDSCQPSYSEWTSGPRNHDAIVSTTSGSKMLMTFVTKPVGYQEVYSLPGNLPGAMQAFRAQSGVTSTAENGSGSAAAFPNPASKEVRIVYTLPAGATTADLVISDVLGKECKRYRVGSAFNDILISPGELSSGTYFYSLVSEKGRSEVRKLVVGK